jgi:beta-lactamase class D
VRGPSLAACFATAMLAHAALSFAAASPAAARTLCTLVADAADGRVLVEAGDCAGRVTPASTFKVPLALMGFDAGVIADVHAPVLTIRPGEPDWLGDAWRQPTDPTRWMKYSVVWYSQRIATALGVERLARTAEAFGYGNADFSGDAGKDNGLERAWIGSSLQVSPREQVAFLRRLVRHELPVSPHAVAMTEAIVETFPAGGWTIHGKTGSAFPRRADGSLDRDRAWGWFVGWAERDGRTLVFARLTQTEKRGGPAGPATRDGLLADWPALVAEPGR